MRAMLMLLTFLWPLAAHCAPAPLAVPHAQLGQAGSGVPANLLLNLSLTFEDAGAAYREPYQSGTQYAGYFNARLCYRYPLKGKDPDLGGANGYFFPARAADARFECGGDSFSGNLLNWATTSTLDLLRYGLTGGDRVVDQAGLTVLQRAWLPDGAVNPDFYAHPRHFPRKSIGGADAARLTPFGAATLYIVSCRNRVMFSPTQKGKRCDAPRYGASGRLLVSDKFFGEFNARVSVCGAQDAASRPDLCRPSGAEVKPEGTLQSTGRRLRIGVMSYLSEAGAADPNAYGGALRAALGPSGPAIDFINRMGRSNPQRLGVYRVNDPGAELFYEALRYLQGRAPSFPAAASDDGLPLLSARADPVLGACQRNVIATIGHPAFVNDRFVPGNTRAMNADAARGSDTFAATGFDIMAATRKVGEMEADSGGGYGNPSPRPDLARLDTLDAGAGGSGSHYLAGAAYWAHVNPIRSDKPVKVDSLALQLGASPSERSSALYLAAKYGAFDDRNRDANPFITTGNRRDSSEWSSDGATPAAFFSGTQPQALIGSVRALFGAAGARPMASEGPSALWQGKGGAFVITSSSDQGRGSGTLQRRTLTLGTAGAVSVAAQPAWDAAELLDGNPRKAPPVPTAAVEARNIFTYAGKGGATVAFTWPQLPPQVRAVLDAGDGLGEQRTAFLRGERSGELGQPGGLFRQRASILGDFLRSTPLIAGTPPVVYAGANDGMLHAFSAADGAELFAYVPGALLGRLPELASPSWAPAPFVDASAGHGEALIGGATRHVLASGMGMGARGVFALDITDPANFGSGAGALWEFTEQDDPAMGHVHAPPVIAAIVNGSGAKAGKRPAVIVSSGINSLSTDGSGALFLLALDKPPGQAWQHGVNYFRIPTPRGDPALANALSPPAVISAGDGGASFAWAGDLQGNLWRFDLRTLNVQRLFTARAGAVPQPIAHAPKVVFAPGGGYLVIFGTGKFIEQADTERASFATQSLYAIHDRLLDKAAPVSSRAELARRTLEASGKGYLVKGGSIDYFASDARRGWYVDFPDARSDGERAAGSPVSAAGAILFATLLPGGDGCTSAGRREYVLDAVSGLALDAGGMTAPDAVTGELAPAAAAMPMLIDFGSTTGPRSATGEAMATRLTGFLSVRPGDGAAAASRIKVTHRAKRLGWREVFNWQELHDRAAKQSQ